VMFAVPIELSEYAISLEPSVFTIN
jgi:hypothetical protein